MKNKRLILMTVITVLVMSSFACSLGSINFRPDEFSFSSTDETVVEEDTSTVPTTTDEETVVTVVNSTSEELYVNLYKEAIKGVVVIQTYVENSAYGTGTGFVFDKDGHIVTNLHVIEDADTIVIGFETGTKVYAEVVGEDPDSDLAVLSVDMPADELYPLPLGDSGALQVGQSVVAIGNPFGHNGTMTTGIVSALGRTLDSLNSTPDGSVFSAGDLVQTDAAINPGNSGGPLLNLAGEVIGVNRAIESSGYSLTGQGQNSGVGFAVSSNIVNRVVPDLIAQGYVDYPYLGVTVYNEIPLQVAEELGLEKAVGFIVSDVSEGGPADEAGLQAKDTVVGINGIDVKNFDELLSYLLANVYPGESVTLTYIRDGQTMTTDLVVGARPRSN